MYMVVNDLYKCYAVDVECRGHSRREGCEGGPVEEQITWKEWSEVHLGEG